MGLANIKHTAEKYHGGVDWTAEGKVFMLSVMMKMKGEWRMSVSGVNGIGVAAYAYTNSSKKTVEESNLQVKYKRQGKVRIQQQLPLHGRGIWLFRIRQIIVGLHMIAPFPISRKRK